MAILSENVHPLVLGDVYRTRSQIKMLGSRLLSRHMKDQTKIEKILSFLCSDSGSHDYMIYRREASEELGLNVEKPDDNLYAIIRELYNDFASELKLTEPFNPLISLGGQDEADYSFTRGLVESVIGGSYKFISEGSMLKQQIPDPNGNFQTNIQDNRVYEGWRHENP